MRENRMFKIIGLSVITAGLLVGCGDSVTATSNSPVVTSSDKLAGSLLKGPITNATVTIYDANGKEVGQTTSMNGKFLLPTLTLTSEYYTIESTGGSYEDEATKTTVNISENDGLKTLVSKTEFEEMLTKKEFVSLTPETTIFAELTKEKIDAGMDLATASSESEQLIYDLLIKDSSPMPMLEGDVFSKRGDLTQTPSKILEAFAKNRAIAFSTFVKELNIAPERAFEIMSKIKEDIKDGKSDGIDVDGDGTVDVDGTQEYALARTKLFNNTTNRLRNGELSPEETENLRQMGFDVESIQTDRANKDANLSAEVSKYMASTTLPTLHILETMSDEDGDSTDAKETYTLTANTEVNVTIETPNGSWVTPMWRYNNKQLPLVIRTNRGTAMTLKLDNQLDSDSTIHWHGFKIPAIMDGGPDVPVASGTTKDYTFTMSQPASSMWFHPHPDMETGKQVYMGLAGAFLLEDEISKKLEADKNLPSGDRDVVLLVQDRRFAPEENGVRKLQYMTMGMDSDGMLGDKVLVNGSVIPKYEVDTAQYRFRLYNVSNARNYKFAFNDGRKFKVVGTDGGLLNEPVELDSITLGAAERVEIVVDFSKDTVGTKVMMVSQPTAGDMMSMMGGMDGMDGMGDGNSGEMAGMNGMNDSSEMGGMNGMSGMGDGNSSGMAGMNDSSEMGGMNGMSGMGSMSNNGMGGMMGMAGAGEGLVIMRFDVTTAVTDDVTLYEKLPSNAEIATRIDPATAVNSDKSRQFVMMMDMGNMGNMDGNMGSMNNSNNSGGMNMTFVINGKTFDMNRVDEFIGAGSTEIWEIKNASPMAHPFHAHAVQYQILSRNGVPATGVDLGWKDTFLVQPGESIKIIAKFDPVLSVGDYMYHCHILEHEDAGMMGYFRVGESGNVGSSN